MDQIITLSAALTAGFGLLAFLAKQQFNDIKNGIMETKNQNRENDKKVNERIDKLEEGTDVEIADIKKELNDIKGDFATTFVLREDFFRSMNGVEDRMRSIDGKIDRLLMQNNSRKE